MGTPSRRHQGLAAALFTTTQQRVLGLLFGQPDRSFYATQLISMTSGGSGAVQRELARLELAALVRVTRHGNQKHYQADSSSPIFEELCSIARKTVGLCEPLREALEPLATRIHAAFVYGSVAKRSDTARSDIDLFVVSDEIEYATLIEAIQDTEMLLGRPINPTLLTTADLEQRIVQNRAFVTRVMGQPKLWLIGSEDRLSSPQAAARPTG
jgi:predicted nucleotidyltransferase